MLSKLRLYASTKTKLLFIAPVFIQVFESFDPTSSHLTSFEASFNFYCQMVSEIESFDI